MLNDKNTRLFWVSGGLLCAYLLGLVWFSIGSTGSSATWFVFGAAILGLLLGMTRYQLLAAFGCFWLMIGGVLILLRPEWRSQYAMGAAALTVGTPACAWWVANFAERQMNQHVHATLRQRQGDIVLGYSAFLAAVTIDVQPEMLATLVRLDFSETVLAVLGRKRYAQLLGQLLEVLGQEVTSDDSLYYLQKGQVVILSTGRHSKAAWQFRQQLRAAVQQLATQGGLASTAIIVRFGQTVFGTDVGRTSPTDLLARLTRDAEVDIVKEYL